MFQWEHIAVEHFPKNPLSNTTPAVLIWQHNVGKQATQPLITLNINYY